MIKEPRKGQPSLQKAALCVVFCSETEPLQLPGFCLPQPENSRDRSHPRFLQHRFAPSPCPTTPEPGLLSLGTGSRALPIRSDVDGHGLLCKAKVSQGFAWPTDVPLGGMLPYLAHWQPSRKKSCRCA